MRLAVWLPVLHIVRGGVESGVAHLCPSKEKSKRYQREISVLHVISTKGTEHAGSSTYCASEAIAVPFSFEGVDEVALDRILTASTLWSKETEIILFAIWLIVMDHVPIVLEWVSTLSTKEVARVPALS